MKKITLFLFMLFICFNSAISAAESKKVSLKSVLSAASRQMTAGHIRVQPEEIVVCNKGVFVNLNGQLLAVESLAADNEGLYCLFDEDDDADVLWECNYCYTLNKMSRVKCKKCGTTR